ncbi:hypothetical protein [Chromobacterium amazonense]|uniref:Uncharacterized protein n=1 Tax=Chromobacterium amazonense TaxID=1382803 RepID=A0ABU8UXV1_9NEIS|nr:hypothetical protein [Chromobacterium amazonense]MDQ4541154.1 hypothetical protein [Chromobacterium amazonense]
MMISIGFLFVWCGLFLKSFGRGGGMIPAVSLGGSYFLGRSESRESIASQASQASISGGGISVGGQVLDDLELFCDELLSKNFLGSGKGLDSNFSQRVTIPRAESWAYEQYRNVADGIECLSKEAQVDILKNIAASKPDNVSVMIQGVDVPLNEVTAESVGSEAINALVLTGSDGGFSQDQEGRISIKINPERYGEAFLCLCSLKDKFKEDVSHTKLMLPSVVGSGPEDAVIYLNNISRVDDVVSELSQVEGMLRASENGIFFMDELAPGVYKGVLPKEAYSTDEAGAAGSLGMYYSKLAVKAAAYSLTQAVPSREAAEFVLEQAGLRVEK